MTGIEGWLESHQAGIATGLLVVGAVLAFVKWVLPKLRQIGHLVDDLAGEPARPGVPARPGLMVRMQTVEEAVLSDKATRQALQRIEERLGGVDEHLTKLDEDVLEATKDRAELWRVIENAQLAPPPPLRDATG